MTLAVVRRVGNDRRRMPWKPREKGEPTPSELFRDAFPTTIVCGVDGCKFKRKAPFAEAKAVIAEHRALKHPDWEPPVYRTKGRKRIRVK